MDEKIQENIEEKLRSHSDKLPIIGSIIALLSLISIFIGGTVFHYFVFFDWIIFSLLLGLIATMAGFVVLKALFLLAGELSLLIFLSQSYCASPSHTPYSDTALRSLVALGLLYMIYSFVISIYSTLKERYGRLNGEKWTLRRVLVIGFYIAFVLLFVWEIFLVIRPIITSFCVYH